MDGYGNSQKCICINSPTGGGWSDRYNVGQLYEYNYDGNTFYHVYYEYKLIDESFSRELKGQVDFRYKYIFNKNEFSKYFIKYSYGGKVNKEALRDYKINTILDGNV